MDRFINNRAPKRLLLIFILMTALSLGLSFFTADKCAKAIVSRQIRAELAAAGGGRITAPPEESSIAAGEERFGDYGIDRSLPPEIMPDFPAVRRTVFIPLFSILTALSAIWLALSVRELMTLYRDLEKLRAECIAAADKPSRSVSMYGEDLSTLRRISESADLLAGRLNSLSSRLSGEQKYLRSFLTDLSHQIKTSLAVVRLNTDILSEIEDLPEERREKLSDEIQLNLDGMERLVVEAIKLAKLNAGAVEYDMELCSPAEACSLAIRRMAPLLRRKNINVTASLPEDIKLVCDKAWLCEAVENVIKNSADHSECTEIRAELAETPVMVTIAISDNGKGIPQEDIPKLFERFSSGSKDTTMYSSGLGMSIAQKIMRAHGGDILAYSEPGKGTRFEFVFIKS
ncbi:MAG: HAMP domain-containing histidine kinase [Ruminococcus sp.]|nr:HAMP domain-containing histidine kinase [Ruminococcus sp.]